VSARILYVEDDLAQARLAKKCLERAGFEVDLALDGQAGLDQCAACRYDAVVVDQTMPGLSGLDVIRALGEQYDPPPPTIMVTGTGNESIAVEAMKLGLSEYLVKDLEGGFVNVLPLVVERAIAQRRTLLEKRRIERELAQAEKLRAIGQLAAGIAHEVNTPTQYLGDNVRFLQNAFGRIIELLEVYGRLFCAARERLVSDELLAEVEAKRETADLDFLLAEIPEALRQSLEGVEHVAGIVGAMKEYAHPDAGRQQPVDLNHLITGALALCRGQWKHSAEVVTDFDVGLPPVRCLPADMSRVVVNLVVNAAHANAEAAGRDSGDSKRPIFVRTRRDGSWAELRVEDSGPGVPDAIRDHIFEPFFTTKDIGVGSGQGLAIARGLVVENHGGTIHFEPRPGGGAAFVVRLPIEGRPDAPAELPPLELQNGRIAVDACNTTI